MLQQLTVTVGVLAVASQTILSIVDQFLQFIAAGIVMTLHQSFNYAHASLDSCLYCGVVRLLERAVRKNLSSVFDELQFERVFRPGIVLSGSQEGVSFVLVRFSDWYIFVHEARDQIKSISICVEGLDREIGT